MMESDIASESLKIHSILAQFIGQKTIAFSHHENFKYYTTISLLYTYCDDRKHHLGHIKGMPPVVVYYIAVVLLHTQKPPA
jgi:hypothetical protein